jgi:dTDP-4-dehydrorhamnose 3,5-epimerase
MHVSKLNVEKTTLRDVLQIRPLTDFADHRGRYLELYNKEAYLNAGIDIDFPQDDVSISKSGVLRGIHGDEDTWKLVTCLIGSIHLIVVNNDESSAQYRQWASFLINDKNRLQILVPPKFGNGHQVISEIAVFHYKQSSYYLPGQQFTIAWDDPLFGFNWPSKNPILSFRDSNAPWIV